MDMTVCDGRITQTGYCDKCLQLAQTTSNYCGRLIESVAPIPHNEAWDIQKRLESLQAENEELKRSLITRDGALTSKILKAENERLKSSKDQNERMRRWFEERTGLNGDVVMLSQHMTEIDKRLSELEALQSKLDRVIECCNTSGSEWPDWRTEILDLLK